jgi:imidazolonepropionase-like amidohydrolase
LSMRRFPTLLILALLPVTTVAQERLTLLHAGWLLAEPGSSPLTEQTIVIAEDRVREVRAGYLGAADFPQAEVMIVDLGAAYVLPGLLDMHVHLTLTPGVSADVAHDTEAELALVATEHARITVEAGITTVRDLGSQSSQAILAVRDAIERGAIPGPRVLAAGQPVSATGGHGDIRFLREDVAELSLSAAVCDGADACRRAVRDLYKQGVDTIKLHATGGGADPNGRRESLPEMFDDELLAITETAHALDMRVAAHAHGTSGIAAALAAGVDSIEHGSWINPDIIETFKRQPTWLVPTAYLQDWFLARTNMPESAHASRRQNVALMHPMLSRAMQEGVKIAMGTDAGIMPHGENAHEIVKYVELGMLPMQAIETATTSAAELMGMSAEVGRIGQGYYADIIAVGANPLEDISTLLDVPFVMAAGRVVKSGL